MCVKQRGIGETLHEVTLLHKHTLFFENPNVYSFFHVLVDDKPPLDYLLLLLFNF